MDWRTLFFRIRESGLSRPSIAKALGVPFGTIHKIPLRSRPEPDFDTGVALINLHQTKEPAA